jgi:hypothetical protein
VLFRKIARFGPLGGGTTTQARPWPVVTGAGAWFRGESMRLGVLFSNARIKLHSSKRQRSWNRRILGKCHELPGSQDAFAHGLPWAYFLRAACRPRRIAFGDRPMASAPLCFSPDRNHDRLRHVRRTLEQVRLTAIVVAGMCWFTTFGPISAILACMIGKHVLVAILAMRLGMKPELSSPT